MEPSFPLDKVWSHLGLYLSSKPDVLLRFPDGEFWAHGQLLKAKVKRLGDDLSTAPLFTEMQSEQHTTKQQSDSMS